MNYNENMRTKLKSNIIVVLFFLTIATGLFIWKLVQIYGQTPSLLEIQSVLILKDYLVFIYFGYGVVALVASVLVYFHFDKLFPQRQIILFMSIGVLFLPFTIIMVVIGIMKYMESNKFKIQFFTSSVLALIVLAVGFSISLTKLAEIEPVYKNQYVYTLLFQNGPDNHMEFEVTATARGMKLEKVEITGTATLAALNPLDFTAKSYTLKIARDGLDRMTCFDIINSAEVVDREFNCEMIDGGYFEEMHIADFIDPTFEMQIGSILGEVIEIPYRAYVSIENVEYIPNVYNLDQVE